MNRPKVSDKYSDTRLLCVLV